MEQRIEIEREGEKRDIREREKPAFDACIYMHNK
jgi:hypothetical protein